MEIAKLVSKVKKWNVKKKKRRRRGNKWEKKKKNSIPKPASQQIYLALIWVQIDERRLRPVLFWFFPVRGTWKYLNFPKLCKWYLAYNGNIHIWLILLWNLNFALIFNVFYNCIKYLYGFEVKCIKQNILQKSSC